MNAPVPPAAALLDAVDPLAGPTAADAATMLVIEERLDVQKRSAASGGAVRLHKLVHEETVTVDEPLAADVVDVERVAVGRPIDGPVAVRHEGDTMIVPVVEERLVVSRQLVLVEEIRVTRHSQTRHAPQAVTLRREEVVAERRDPASGDWVRIDSTAAAAAGKAPDGSGTG